ncbi:MAG: HpcH/HpaI aldolase/citrate lyase family protein [Acidimicrobiales bacterium]
MTNQHATTTDYLAIRSILETPILDDHKWAKLPNIGADMVFIDLEDSVPPHRKDEARDKACEWLGRLDWFGDKAILARPNHLDTPWGEADVKALAEAGVTCMAYPKITNRGDLDRVIGLLSQHGASPDIFAIIEMAGAVLEMKEIATTPGVVALMSGPGDLSVDAGMELFEPDGELNPVFLMMKTQTVLTGVVYGLATTDIAYVPDLRDLTEVRRRVEGSHRMGFTAMSTFYPPHVDIINDVLSGTPEQVAKAEAIVEAYEVGLERGDPAVLSAEGEVLLVHDYEKAKRLLRRAGRAKASA